MSHDTNTVDSRTHEGQLNKLGFWIFLTAEFHYSVPCSQRY